MIVLSIRASVDIALVVQGNKSVSERHPAKAWRSLRSDGDAEHGSSAFPYAQGRIISDTSFPLSATNAAPPPFTTSPPVVYLAIVDPNHHVLPRTYEWNARAGFRQKRCPDTDLSRRGWPEAHAENQGDSAASRAAPWSVGLRRVMPKLVSNRDSWLPLS